MTDLQFLVLPHRDQQRTDEVQFERLVQTTTITRSRPETEISTVRVGGLGREWYEAISHSFQPHQKRDGRFAVCAIGAVLYCAVLCCAVLCCAVLYR
jgi:hypothetical protein